MGCEGCKEHYNRSHNACIYCLRSADRPHWTPNNEIAELIEAAERKAFQDCTAIIKKKLSDLISKREMLTNAYNEMMADIPNCPNQFNSHEYKVVDRQCDLLYEILKRIEEEGK